MRKLPKSILKISAGLIVSLIIVILLLYFFIQTETFNKWTLELTLDKLNEHSQTTGVNINVDSIQGNILQGLILKNGNVKIKEDTLFSFSFIDLKYDLPGLLDHEIRLHNVIINSPVINLSKIKDSNDSTVWNISKLFTSSKEPDTSQSVFDWGVVIENLKIVNGSMTLEGQLKSEMPEWRRQKQMMKEFDFNNLEVKDLELELKANYFTDHKNITIRNFSCSTNSDFNVRKLALTYGFTLNDTLSEVQNLELITDKSQIKINKGKMSGFNLLDVTTFENLKDKDIEADINITQFDFDELRFFIPAVDMLDSTVALTLNASGKYGDLNINKLNLKLPNSEINLTGNLKKLDDAENLYMDVYVKDSRIFLKDVKTIVKIKSIPDYSHAGNIYPELTYTGTYKSFYSKFAIATSAGNVSGHVSLDLPAEEYNGKVIAVNLNPGKILKDNSVTGNVNLIADFSGHGFNPNTMSTNVKYQMGSSNISGYDVRNSAGNIILNGKNVNINIRHSSSIGSVFVKGSVNFSNLKNPGYRLRGSVSNLNVTSITKSADDRSNLNFSFDIEGKGITPENLNGKYNFSILPSVYGSHEIPQTKLTLEVRNSETENLIDMVSDIADLKAVGKFKFEDVINAVSQNVAVASEKLSSKLKSDSVQLPETELIKTDDFALDYSLSVKDSVKINILLAPFNIMFNGSSTGHLENNTDSFSFSSILDIPNFAYEDTMIVLNNFSSDVFFSNDYMNYSGDNSLEGLQLNLKTQSDKVVFENLAIDSVKVLFNMDNSVAVLNAEVKDSTLPGYLNGSFNLNTDSIVSVFDTISVSYNQYRVKNSGDWILNYVPDESIRIQQMRLGSRDAVINISGNYSFNSSSDISIEGNDLRVQDLIDVFYPIDTSGTKEKYSIEGLLKKLSVNFKGTPANPELNVIVISSELKYEERNFGTLNINGGYKNENALLNINLINEGGNGKLAITGNLPLENPMSSDSANKKSENQPVSLKVKADDFQYEYFLKLIPGMPLLGGIMNGELNAEGTAYSPDLKGSMKISGGSFFFGLTGMNYNYDLSASAQNSKLVLNNLKLYNKYDKARHIDIYGNIDLAGMKLNDIDLMTSGDMIILDNDVELNDLEVYGYVLAGIGKPAVSIKGNLDKLRISGQLIVRDATISSLPAGTGYDVKKDNFKYVLLPPDKNFTKADTLILVPEVEYYKIEPFKKSKYLKYKKRTVAAEFLDIDINIKTVKSIIASLDFDKISFAKLFGELTANLNLKTENEEIKAIGDVDVIGNSYFKLYKDFKLKDSRIIFDGRLEDPVLDIQAVHTGTKVSEQYGNSASTEVEVKLTVTGKASDPKVRLMLIENGTEITGPGAQADAVSYLLYGKFKSELTESERSSVASAIGVAYISQYVLDVVGEIFPFFTEATFTVGDKPLKELKNFEFSVDYPLNNLLNIQIPETLLMEFFREELDENFNATETTMNTGLKIIYKIKF